MRMVVAQLDSVVLSLRTHFLDELTKLIYLDLPWRHFNLSKCLIQCYFTRIWIVVDIKANNSDPPTGHSFCPLPGKKGTGRKPCLARTLFHTPPTAVLCFSPWLCFKANLSKCFVFVVGVCCGVFFLPQSSNIYPNQHLPTSINFNWN